MSIFFFFYKAPLGDKAAVNDVYSLGGGWVLSDRPGCSNLPYVTVKVNDLTLATSVRAIMGGQKKKKKDSEVGLKEVTDMRKPTKVTFKKALRPRE